MSNPARDALSPERWRQVEALLDRLLDAAAAERAALLHAAGEADPDLRARAEALLRAEETAPAFLESDAASFAAPVLPDVFTAGNPVEAGRHVGPYRLLRLIGYGGSSVVYLAERADRTFRRRVALKLLRTIGANTEERRRRFRAERQILASLQHPNIAQIFDGGMTAHEQPYLAMEYVEGLPLTEYCSMRSCSMAERVRLVEDVCRAVQHAQHRLIVHRDLKPSNILVTDAGQVKLLDFGIAKLLDPGSAEVPLTMPLTQAGGQWVTPEYAAPEQVRGEAVTTATDVYSLGVVLYELLTGRRPYVLDVTSPSAIERTVCWAEPPPPSAVAPPPLAAGLRGDLDTIVMKALRKEPTVRYASAGELAGDLGRYREGLPIAARPPTFSYRTRKFVRRHRWGVGAACGLLFLLIGFIAALSLQQRTTAHARDRARIEAETATQITATLLDLFKGADPREARSEPMTVAGLLDRGVERARQLDTQPVVQAQLLYMIGMAYHGMGNYDAARRQMEAALALRRRHLGPSDPALAVSLNQLGWMSIERRAFEEARAGFAEALEVLRRSGSEDPEVANSLHGLGLAYNGLEDRITAEALLREALAVRRRLLGAAHPEVANVLNDLGLVQHGAGDDVAAEVLLREALAMRRAVLGSEHLDVAQSLTLVGRLRTRSGDYETAEAFYLEALAVRQRRLEVDHPLILESMRRLAELYVVWEKPARAAEYGTLIGE